MCPPPTPTTASCSYAEAKAAKDAVLAVSLTCLGVHGCLSRSLATALLCRMRGSWPTWCTGVRVRPPFGAHAWVEAEGRAVDEPTPDGYLAPLITVGQGGQESRGTTRPDS
ncbi:lasso peptide biosynthesis B2 protein [Nonomuraea angiospora]|uniref:lasso peptide biosynthesis B2 protein n=1 Tax=Nonomuraea angiospora TaxID=46172 RepID=UPI00378FEE3A